jgi:predicted dehydrogenase
MMITKPVKTAIVGTGTISSIYLQTCTQSPLLEIVACADLDLQRARTQATTYNVPRAVEVADVLTDPEIELVINLTIPAAHGTVALAAVRAGKSVYNEKPLTISRADGRLLLDEARAHGVLVGCAPDTFLGGGLQTCRKLIDDGAIGQPVAATAFMLGHGPERWHPDPAFFYQIGGGPMFDMGPYYLTALIALLGPVRRVTGSTRISFAERTITSQPKCGTVMQVETPTHIASVLDFASGPIGTLVTSFDVWHANVPRIEIYGSEGSLSVPDPNTFRGPVRVRMADDEEWREVPLTHGYTENSRGIGVIDLAAALRTGRTVRASGDLAYHVLDIMHAAHDASDRGTHIDLPSTCDRPVALPEGAGPIKWNEA